MDIPIVMFIREGRERERERKELPLSDPNFLPSAPSLSPLQQTQNRAKRKLPSRMKQWKSFCYRDREKRTDRYAQRQRQNRPCLFTFYCIFSFLSLLFTDITKQNNTRRQRRTTFTRTYSVCMLSSSLRTRRRRTHTYTHTGNAVSQFTRTDETQYNTM